MVRARRWIALVGLSVLAFPLIPALILVVWAETWRGRGLGVALVGAVIALVCLLRAPRWAAGVGGACAALLVTLFVTAPLPRDGPRFASVFLDGAHDRWALASVVPELDQVVVGLHLVAFLDQIIDADAARKLGEIVLPLYRAMAADPEIDALGSEMSQAYANLWMQPFDVGHYFRATPPNPGLKPPALLFIHGSAGNFKSYLWALRSLSAEHGLVVAHPSFGFGNWDRPGGVEAIERVRQHLIDVVGVDPERIYLVGLSNGGLGASLAAARHPTYYRAVGFISPVFDDRTVESDAFADAWRGRRMLILTGDADDRVPAPYVVRMAELLAARGVVVDLRVYEGEDHFLLFAALDRALEELVGWVGRCE